MPKSACFDVLGTCFHFGPLIDLIDSILKRDPEIKTNIDASTLFHGWFFAGQRDFTYTSMVGSYTPIAQILMKTFRRALAVVDYPDPQKNITDEDLEMIKAELLKLPPRPYLKDIFDGLRHAGWDVYGVTNGGKQASLKYYKLANVELDDNHLLSCDDLKAAKPDMRVYENANSWLESRGCEAKDDNDNAQRWFVAAHAWDLIAARKAGFKTAWVAHEEHDPVTDVFGKFDVYGANLKEVLEKMLTAERTA